MIDPDKFLEEVQQKNQDKKRRAAINFRAIREKQCLSLFDLSGLLNIREKDLAVFEKYKVCSDEIFNKITDWMMETLNKRPD